MTKAIKIIYYIIMAIIALWILLSWWEIGFHNNIPHYTYSAMNFFTIIF